MPSSHDSGLTVALDAPLPLELKVGRGTALFVAGTCFHREGVIRSLELIVDGAPQPVAYHRMPRLDLFRSLHPQLDAFATRGIGHDPDSAGDPWLHSYRSGFWGIAEIAPARGGPRRLELRATLQGGETAVRPLVTLTAPAVPEPQPVPESVRAAGAAGPLVAVAMATYQPPPALFERQIESIRAQTHGNWVCVISDDGSSPERLAEMRAVLGDDPRFVLSPSPRRLGFYLNFERALDLVPGDADYVALADQDDAWLDCKLQELLARIGDAQLVYSDARVVDEAGRLLSETYWVTRRHNHDSLAALLMTNSVTGAASLLRRGVLDYALPFPPAQFAHFHDHWIALVAIARGRIEFVDRPLYDYVQHGGATLGHAAANRMPGLVSRLRRLTRHPRDRAVLWRHHYFVDVCRLSTWATIVRMRCGEEMAADKRRSLERFLATDRSLPALAGLWRRGAREILGRSSRTLGAEWMLAYAFTWRRLLSASVRDRPSAALRLDAVPPPELVSTPGRRVGDSPTVRALSDKIAPLPLLVSDAAPARINLLIPSVDLQHLFGGYIGKFNLARRLADNGQRVRIVTVDPNGLLAPDYRQIVERYSGLDGLFDEVELAFGRETGALEVSAQDRFIATTWWTAHIAHAATVKLGAGHFVYLIQEYEPFTFPMGSQAALAAESYELPHHALFSTELLRDYFRAHRIGPFAPGGHEAQSASFQNAIASVPPPTADALRRRGTRGLLLYARPESHASRNMFELAVLALERALDDGAFAGWELRGIGSVGGARRLALTGGATLELLPRRTEPAYAELLRDHDVGLALMYTPHPSLVPLEMASAGMLTVTNTFENKTAEALGAISTNLLPAPPTIGGIAAALRAAADGVERYEDRARGSAVSWSRDWRQSLPDVLINRVIGWLRG
ncbi:MAG TPA: glycosyltransferase [Solirubrobacteraceae bacterium]|nr:glycosyltransferase [Solirubrobacteraceae bacterium]